MSKQKVGLIGLGAMGRGVARRLLAKGFSVIGFDVREESLEWMRQEGGAAAASLSELASEADVVVSFVINSSQTESVLFGPDGLVGKLRKGSVFISCSTMDPAYVEGLTARLQDAGIQLLDAPVTGGPEGANQGTLTIMAAGDERTCNEVMPVLQAMGSRVHHLGAAGAGSKMKVINQLLVGANLAAAAEAMALAQHLGLPHDTTLEILSSGAASSWMLNNRGPRMISAAYDDVNASVDIFLKDLSLVLDTTRAAKFPSRLAHTAYLSFLEASARGRGLKDGAVIVRNYECDSSKHSI